jgi:hypothetical protein
MNFYELLDARTSTLARVDTLFRFWVTITFAVIVSAYVAGPNLGWVAGVGVATLYGILTIGNIMSIRNDVTLFRKVIGSLSPGNTESENSPEVLVQADMLNGQTLNFALLGIQLLGSFGALAYLFYRLTGGS